MAQTEDQVAIIKSLDYRQVTTHPDIDLSPRISPDGKWMAYITRQAGNYDIWIRSTSGGRSQQITFHKSDDFYPAWFPNNRTLVFVSQRSDAAGDIWKIKLYEEKDRLYPKGEPEQFTTYSGYDGYPTVSPDAKKVAWVSDRTGRDEIWFHNDNTGNTTQLTFLGGTHPCWSPDLRFIAFTSFRAEEENNGDIWMINLKGPKPSDEMDLRFWDPREPHMWRVTTGSNIDGFPSWSLDAKRLLFLRYAFDTNKDHIISPADEGMVWAADVNESPEPDVIKKDPIQDRLNLSFNLRMVRYALPMTAGAENAMQPWQGADGRIYFTSDRGGNLDIWSFDGQGHIPKRENVDEQFYLANSAYPLPDNMSRQTLGPLFLDWDPAKIKESERKIAWDRALAFHRIMDFYGPQSSRLSESLYEMAVCFQLLGYEDQAKIYYEMLLDNYPDNRTVRAYAEMAFLGMRSRKKKGEEKYGYLINGLTSIVNLYQDQSEPGAAGQISIGDLLYRKREYTRAFTEYSKVLKNFPQERDICAESQLKIGDVFKEFATKNEVVNAYLEVVKNYPEQRQWMIPARNRILALLTEGITSESGLLKRYREIAGQYSGFSLLAAAAQLEIGDILFKAGDNDAALEEFELVEKLYPNLVDEVFTSQMSQIRTLLKIGENLRAFNLLEKLEAQYRDNRPDLADIAHDELLKSLLAAGDELKRNGDFALAVSWYIKAKKMDQRSVAAHRGYIECMYFLQKTDQVIIEYEQLFQLNSKDNIIIYALGLAYSYKGTEKADLYGDPDGLDPAALGRSSNLIALALSYDYTLIQAYLTISYNYEMMENYQARQRAKPKKLYRKAVETVSAPLVWFYHTVTFHKTSKPPRYYERAIHELTKAIGLNDAEEDPGLEASLALNLANNYYNLGEFGYEKAFEYFQVKLKYDSSFVDKEREALIYSRIGHCALVVKDLVRGPGYLQHAIKLNQELENESMVLINTKRLALLYEMGDQNHEAIDLYQKTASIEKKNNYDSDLMRSYRSIAYNYYLLGEPKDAVLYSQRALELLENGKAQGYKQGANRIKIGFLGLYFPLPFFSLEKMGSASATGFTTDDEWAFVYTILGKSFKEEKDYDKAVQFFEQKLEIFKKRKDDQAIAAFLNNIGYLYYLKGDFVSAWNNYNASLDICEEKKIYSGLLKNTFSLSQIVINLSQTEIQEVRPDREELNRIFLQYLPVAAKKVNRALTVIKDLNMDQDYCRLLLRLAELNIINTQDKPPESVQSDVFASIRTLEKASLAESLLEEAIFIGKREKLHLELCSAYYIEGTLGLAIQDLARAFNAFSEARRISLRYGYYDILWRVNNDLGHLVAGLDSETKRDLLVQRDALEYFLESIQVLEAHPSEKSDATSAQIRLSHLAPYREIVRYLSQKGDKNGSLAFAERMRSKLFYDLMSHQSVELRKQRHKLFYNNAIFVRDRINELEINLLRSKYEISIPARQIATWRKELKTYQAEYDDILNNIKKEVPELEALVQVTTVPQQEVQRNLRNNEVILYYFMSDDFTLVWTLTRNNLDLHILSLSKQDFILEKEKLLKSLYSNQVETIDIARTLLPSLDSIKTNIKNLVIIPDGELFTIPWSAMLQVAGITETSTSCVVSTSLTGYFYGFQNRKLQGTNVYLSDNKNLASSLSTTGYNIISPVSGSRDNSFSVQASALGMSDLVHLSGQGLWNINDPALSQIGYNVFRSAMAIFRPTELYQITIPANLVSVDFKEAIPPTSSMELFITLERAFLYAGASTVLFPLQYIGNEDHSTFYSLFYEKKRSMPAAMAFSETQREMFKKGEPPAHWAGLQLFGFGGMTEKESQQYAVEGYEGKVRRGHSAYDLGEWQDAIRFYEQAYSMSMKKGDQQSSDLLAQRILESAVNGGLWEKGIEWQERLVLQAEKNNNLAAVANGYSNLAYFYTQNAQFTEGVRYKEKYVRLAERYGLHEEEAKSLRETGLIYERGGQYNQAIQFLNQAFEKFKSIKNVIGTAQCLRDLGRIYFVYLDDYTKALFYQEQALPLFRENGISADLVDAIQNLGITHEKIGNYLKTLEYQQEAFNFAQELQDERLVGLSFQHLANVLWKMGDFQNALQKQKKAIEIFEKRGEDKLLSVSNSTLGLISLSLGQVEEALEYEQTALNLAVQQNDKRDQATIFKNMAMIYRASGRNDLALSNCRQATLIDSTIGSKSGLAYNYRSLAALELDMGEFDKSRSFVKRALALSNEIGDYRNKIQSLLVLGDLEFLQKNYVSAISYFKQVAQLANEYFMPDIEWRALKRLAQTLENERDRKGAKENYLKALDVIENMRSRIKVEEYASGFIDDKLDVYDALISVLFDEEDFNTALQIAERAKSRNFLDILGNQKITYSNIDSQLVSVGDSLQYELNLSQTELLHLQSSTDSVKTETVEKLSLHISLLKADYQDYLIKLSELNPEFSEMKNIEPLSLDKVQAQLAEHTALIEYFTSKDHLYMWCLKKDALYGYRIDIRASELKEKVFALRDILDRQLAVNESAQELYRLLMEPCAARLNNVKHIVFIPHGSLHYLPFGVLENELGQFAAMEYSMSLAPSASVLGFCLEKGEKYLGQDIDQLPVLGFGNPALGDKSMDLPFAAREVQSLTRYFANVKSYLYERASETMLQENNPYPPLLLFSCHGDFDDATPLFSSILLAPDSLSDGRLEAHEIFNYNLDSYMVALSACETGLGTIRGGDEVIGLVRSFIYAGASSLMTSLWKVDDLATAVLVKRFFQKYGRRLAAC